ncbi:hypothetical protein SISNIDRAFT_446050 [Sistotremastrum niveocremeum HHB9708]|uniref:Glycosyltransferase family 49 protein n=1 Tax=Sistotremastrum niveocremeum HHB9708 TaxID=1314777 RepID=A0A164P0Q3_9AGAM|nr:hypothetical protein SISNIDRAFT_446050 [Sistotremastrum niveocremeum HHB9708]
MNTVTLSHPVNESALVDWPPSTLVQSHSSSFSTRSIPSKIAPFYYKAAYDSSLLPQDITITTLVTQNRFNVLANLAERYQGPISAAIHIPSYPSPIPLLTELHKLYTSNPYMRTYVDVHLVIDSQERQFNMWRNVARYYARTELVMMLDVDFVVCTDFRTKLLAQASKSNKGKTKADGGIMERVKSGQVALVVPAFEYVDQDEGKNVSAFPRDKPTLVDLVKKDKITMFHQSWLPGHGSTNYKKYLSLPSPHTLYKVTTYQHSYEPYIIFSKSLGSWCDERFVGYGGNKAACLYGMYVEGGVEFWVMGDDFLIHRAHGYEEKVRTKERKINQKVYMNYRSELCLRRLEHLVQIGDAEEGIRSRRGKNVLKECSKIKGIAGNVLKVRLMSILSFGG